MLIAASVSFPLRRNSSSVNHFQDASHLSPMPVQLPYKCMIHQCHPRFPPTVASDRLDRQQMLLRSSLSGKHEINPVPKWIFQEILGTLDNSFVIKAAVNFPMNKRNTLHKQTLQYNKSFMSLRPGWRMVGNQSVKQFYFTTDGQMLKAKYLAILKNYILMNRLYTCWDNTKA